MSPRVKPHHHPCQHCGVKIACDGTWEANHDGVPAALCSVFHLESGARNPDFLCEDCQHSLLRQAMPDAVA